MRNFDPNQLLPQHYDITVWQWRSVSAQWQIYQQERYYLTNYEVRGLPSGSGRRAANRTEVLVGGAPRQKRPYTGGISREPYLCPTCNQVKTRAHARRCGKAWQRGE